MIRRPPRSTLFPLHDALPISHGGARRQRPQGGGRVAALVDAEGGVPRVHGAGCRGGRARGRRADRKSTRLNSSHANISYAVFCLKKKKSKLLSYAKLSYKKTC